MTTRTYVIALRENMRRTLSARRWEEAETLLHQLKVEDPLSVQTRGLELEAAVSAGREAEALTLAGTLPQNFPESPRIHFWAGRAYYRLKRYPEALGHFEESDRLHTSPTGRLWVAKTLTQMGRFEEAEALLLSVSSPTFFVDMDLAWLYERQGRTQEALKAYDAHLARHPEDSVARERRLRVKARTFESEELAGEVQRMELLDAPLPEGLLTEYCQKLFIEGRTLEAREEVKRRADTLTPERAVELAWICRQAGAHDLATDLFLKHLGRQTRQFKYLAALESTALRAGRMADLMAAYEALAPQHPNLYGRIKALMKRKAVGK